MPQKSLHLKPWNSSSLAALTPAVLKPRLAFFHHCNHVPKTCLWLKKKSYSLSHVSWKVRHSASTVLVGWHNAYQRWHVTVRGSSPLPKENSPIKVAPNCTVPWSNVPHPPPDVYWEWAGLWIYEWTITQKLNIQACTAIKINLLHTTGSPDMISELNPQNTYAHITNVIIFVCGHTTLSFHNNIQKYSA